MKAVHLQTDYLTEPLGLGDARPRFYWHCEDGKTQTAYRIVCKRDGSVVWDSGKVASASMTHIRYEGKTLASRARVTWSVTLWDENDCAGERAESWFELGLLQPEDWQAQWITGDYRPKKSERYPVDCFRKKFSLSTKLHAARLYATARGVYDVTINGTRLERFVLAPGSTDYRRRIQYQTFDVTALLGTENTLELRLADGWYRGSSAAYGVRNVYGTQTSVLAQLELLYEDGTRQVFGTDESWAWSNDGPVRFADLKDGEVYHAKMRPSYSGRARGAKPPKAPLTASDNVPVTEHERLRPTLLTAKDGTRVLDFGQNIAGYLEFTVRGEAGQRLRLVCGEVLDAEGHVDLHGVQETRPLKGWTQAGLMKKLLLGKVSGETALTPLQQIELICSGGEDHYKSSFTVFGFQYVELIGEIPVEPERFEAIAVYSDLEQTGSFRCSDARVNRLVDNTRWSMKGNFLDVPTDCPTRERLGWTGDAQIFFDTGAYFMNTAPFFAKWLKDMQDAQYANGLIPSVLPYGGVEMMYKSTGMSVGWADAVYLIPYRYYLRFGDRALLQKYWPMMRAYADYLLTHLGQTDKKEAKANPWNACTYEKGIHLGEWLEPVEFQERVTGTNRPKHPEEATAYLYLSMNTLSEIAALMGEDEYAAKLAQTAAGAKKAYLRFAQLDTDRQAKLVRPLALGILEGETKQAAQKRLIEAVRRYQYRVQTGFLSTPFVLGVLCAAGEPEMAYRMLENTQSPGWLYEVSQGATTIWESWEGNESRNHYSPGAVCQWLFDTSAGIRVTGENRFRLAPVPGGSLTFAEGAYQSLYGTVTSRWEKTENGVRFVFTIPANTSAEICLPDGSVRTVGAGRYTYEV